VSVSLCIKCEAWVGAYEKYCPTCVNKYGVAQDETWHKNHWFQNWDVERKAEFEKDLQSAQPRVHRTAGIRLSEPEPVKSVSSTRKRHRHKYHGR
jgi:hypothetical protein